MTTGVRPTLAMLADRRLLAWAVVATIGSLLAYGLITAIIPNPVFGRGIPPAPFAVVVWLASAPLMGLMAATYLAPMPAAPAAPLPARPLAAAARPAGDGGTLGALGSVAAFLAIGCPTCNKIALLLLGASGAVSVFGPIQPFIGAASLILLGVTLGWRLRIRAHGGACAAPM